MKTFEAIIEAAKRDIEESNAKRWERVRALAKERLQPKKADSVPLTNNQKRVEVVRRHKAARLAQMI